MLIALAIAYVVIGAWMYVPDYGYRVKHYGKVRATVNTMCLMIAWPFMILWGLYCVLTLSRRMF